MRTIKALVEFLFAQGKVKVVETEKRKQSPFFKSEASLDELLV